MNIVSSFEIREKGNAFSVITIFGDEFDIDKETVEAIEDEIPNIEQNYVVRILAVIEQTRQDCSTQKYWQSKIKSKDLIYTLKRLLNNGYTPEQLESKFSELKYHEIWEIFNCINPLKKMLEIN